MSVTGLVVLSDGALGWLRAAMLTGTVVCLAVRFAMLRCRGLRRRRGLERLHPVELAYLTGRHDHAILVAALGLLERGSIVPYGPVPMAGALGSAWEHEASSIVTAWVVHPRQMDPEPDTDHHTHPLESAVRKALEEADQSADMSRTWSKVKWSYAMGSTAERLASLGLVADRMTKRAIYAGGAWLVAVLGVALAIDLMGIGGSTTPYLWNLAAFTVGFVVVTTCLTMPSQMPAARRMIRRARAPYESLLRAARRGAGPDPSIALAKLCREPAAVAAYGPSFIWSTDPALAASLGFSPPRRRRKRSAAKAGGGAALAGLLLESTTPG